MKLHDETLKYLKKVPIYDLGYLYNSDSVNEVKKYIRSYEITRDLQVISVNEGTILPHKDGVHPFGVGGVLDKNHVYISESGITDLEFGETKFGGSYEFDESACPYIDETVLYMGYFYPHWGHFIVDFCTRLWYWQYEKRYRIVFMGNGFIQGNIGKPYLDFLQLYGITKDQLIDIRKPTRFKEIIIPEASLKRNQFFSSEYKKMLNEVYYGIDKRELDSAEKIYIRRDRFIKKHGWYRERGEAIIAKTFEKNGFKVISPEELSVEQKIFYMRNCKVLAGVNGSSWMNAAFCEDGVERIYIKKCFIMDPDNPIIDDLTNAGKVTYIDSYFLPFKRYSPPFPDGPHLLGYSKELLRFCHDRQFVIEPQYKYRFDMIIDYVWFLTAELRRGIHLILYPITRRIRKMLRCYK